MNFMRKHVNTIDNTLLCASICTPRDANSIYFNRKFRSIQTAFITEKFNAGVKYGFLLPLIGIILFLQPFRKGYKPQYTLTRESPLG